MTYQHVTTKVYHLNNNFITKNNNNKNKFNSGLESVFLVLNLIFSFFGKIQELIVGW